MDSRFFLLLQTCYNMQIHLVFALTQCRQKEREASKRSDGYTIRVISEIFVIEEHRMFEEKNLKGQVDFCKWPSGRVFKPCIFQRRKEPLIYAASVAIKSRRTGR